MIPVARRVVALVACVALCAATVTGVARRAGAQPLGEPRKIAFANVAHDPAAGAGEIDHLRAYVRGTDGWKDLEEGPARHALEDAIDPLATPERDAVTRGTTILARAQAAFARFEYDEALDDLRQADVILRAVSPTPEVVTALADENLLLGLVQSGRQDEPRALEAFRAVHRLAPDRKALDPARYKPQLVALYAKAGEEPVAGAAGTVVIGSQPAGASVWIDGHVVGKTPIELPNLTAGDHYVAATLDGHATRGDKVHVTQGTRTELPMLLQRLPAEERARAIRTTLLAPGATDADWARGADELADVASVDTIVLVRQKADGTVEGAVYDARARKLGAWTLLASGEAFAEALPKAADAVALPPPDDPGKRGGDLIGGPVDPGEKTHWYKTWWGTSAIIGTGVVVTAVLLGAFSGGQSAGPGFVLPGPVWNP